MSITNFASAISPFKSHQIIPLDFNSIRTVPETHVWPPPGDSDQVFPIPVIDFSGPSESIQNQIAEACEKWSVFQLTNHGIPSELLAETEAQARRLFALPLSQKLKALRSPDGGGGFGKSLLSEFFEKHMWNEGFTIMGSPANHVAPLWPEDQCQVFCDVFEDYQQQMTELAAKLFRLILKSLNISEEEVLRITSPETSNGSLQLNSYPSCPEPARVMGVCPHTDTSLISLIHQGSVKGLQIFKQTVGGGGEWGLVPPVAGALTVNVGDLLHIISNGKFQTVRHRVVLKEVMVHRVSVAFFYYPTPEFVLSPSGDVGAPLYRSVTVKEFRGLKSKCSHIVEPALDAIKTT
ncbi:Gibberellin 3-beta-dioxygenase 3 [Linum grandiflorum]